MIVIVNNMAHIIRRVEPAFKIAETYKK